MKGLDTNVLVRYLTHDDATQYDKARTYLETHCTTQEPCFINSIVLCELIWVLERAYGYTKDELIGVLEKVLLTKQFEVEHRGVAWVALQDFKKSKADFSDCLLGRLNRQTGCDETATFDKATTDLDGFTVL